MPMAMSSARSAAFSSDQLAKISLSLAGDAGEPIGLPDYLRRIQTYGARLHFKQNETIFSKGDTADQVYRIVSGTVRLCRYMPDGRRSIAEFLLPGDVMGFAENSHLVNSAEAVSEVTLLAYSRAWFDQLAAKNPAIRAQLVERASSDLPTVRQLTGQEAKERVASFLLQLADRLDVPCGERLDLPMSRQDIGDNLGLSVDMITRVLTGLRADGVVLIPNTHQIVLRDVASLRELAAERI